MFSTSAHQQQPKGTTKTKHYLSTTKTLFTAMAISRHRDYQYSGSMSEEKHVSSL